LKSSNVLNTMSNLHISISYDSVQRRRARRHVPYKPYGTVHDYVPFYFAPRSPMLYTIVQGNVHSYSEGQDPLVYLVSTVQAIHEAHLQFVFTDGHCIIEYTNFYDDLADLSQIDWSLMRAHYWANTPDDSDRVRRRQAEFLVYRACPWHLITEIGVINREIKKVVVDSLERSSYKPPVIVRNSWYY
jgi:hypothetical protein